ncbi:MAG: hypothetical protein IJD60_10405 [Clostridia bacterium]|nr:hypothetical protein [Clostridia bacterium]
MAYDSHWSYRPCTGVRYPTQIERRPGLLQCALLILKDACPPERRMYYCRFGEDDTPDCETCWQRYLEYVAGGRRDDPYKDHRIDEDDNDYDTCFDEAPVEGGLDDYEIEAWIKDRRASGEGRRWFRGPRVSAARRKEQQA